MDYYYYYLFIHLFILLLALSPSDIGVKQAQIYSFKHITLPLDSSTKNFKVHPGIKRTKSLQMQTSYEKACVCVETCHFQRAAADQGLMLFFHIARRRWLQKLHKI